jgi:hypothetical protein
MSTRDEFSETTKRAVAARASWLCSFLGCGKPTVGPSEESSEAVTMVGKAAHISGAAPGKGSRRYDSLMKPEQRSDISNAIWLCATHADLIDRDEVTYTIPVLRSMKAEHEARCKGILSSGSSLDLGAGIWAIGPSVICVADIANLSQRRWTIRIRHFVKGDIHDVAAFISKYDGLSDAERYVLSNELGEGRLFSNSPVLSKDREGYELLCAIKPPFPRIDVQNLGSGFAEHPKTGDMYVDPNTRDIARVSGVDYFPQKVRNVLSVQQGEDVFHPDFGMRFYEYFQLFHGSPWLNWLLTLDVVRQASIPFTDPILNRSYTPLQCVTRVRTVEVLEDVPTDNRIPLRIDFDVQGLGRWQHELHAYLPTTEQMEGRAKLIASRVRPFNESK